MSLGIAFKGPEGIVLAVDSRVTLTAQMGSAGAHPTLISSTFDNAIKLLCVKGHDYVGAVTYGVGAIGQAEPRTAHSFIPELETELAQANVGRLSIYDFAKRLSDFFIVRWKDVMPPQWDGQDMVFLVGGYNDGEVYGRVYEVFIPRSPDPNECNPGTFGITWGGQGEVAGRMLNGFDPQAFDIIDTVLASHPNEAGMVKSRLQSVLSIPIPYPFLPLQDCIDLSIFFNPYYIHDSTVGRGYTWRRRVDRCRNNHTIRWLRACPTKTCQGRVKDYP